MSRCARCRCASSGARQDRPHANCLDDQPRTNSRDSVIELGRLRFLDRVRLALTDHRCDHQSCELMSSVRSQPTHSRQGSQPLLRRGPFSARSVTFSTVPTFFSDYCPAGSASHAQSHRTSRCRTRPVPMRPVHADIRRALHEHFQFELQDSTGWELHRLSHSNCRTSRSVQLCLSAGEGKDVLRRAAAVDGMGTELFRSP